MVDPWSEEAGGTAIPETASPAAVAAMSRAASARTPDQVLWMTIRNRTKAVDFRDYSAFIDDVMASPSSRTQSFDVLTQATEAFLVHETGDPQLQEWLEQRPTHALGLGRARLDPTLLRVWLEAATNDELQSFQLEEASRLGYTPGPDMIEQLHSAYYEHLGDDDALVLPYLKLVRDVTVLPPPFVTPMSVELLWSYWHEEGMLVHTLDAIVDHFEKRRPADERDALAQHDRAALLPLGDILQRWSRTAGLRLTARRRAMEYDHAYGLTLAGLGATGRTPASSRSRLTGAFHVLLYLAHVFLERDDDRTVVADGFPVLNALRETHLILAEGAHNQFGEVAATARAEMLTMQWILARPDIATFLGGPAMVPYEEPWMAAVASLNMMYDWTTTSITTAHDLAVSGEQILLSVRYGNWSRVNDLGQVANWARYWRPEIQQYLHAFRSATGIDLTHPR